MINNITFDYFQKIDLRVAKIISVGKPEGSKKLLKLKIDLGDETREIVAGIGSEYNSEELIGKKIVVVANLEPKVLMGIESKGMLLAVKSDVGLVLLTVDKEIAPGAKVS